MQKATGRPRILKGKNLFISAAIATLLVQPFYLPLSSGVAFAMTGPNLAISQENLAPLANTYLKIEGLQADGIYGSKVTISGALSLEGEGELETVTHKFTYTPLDGGEPIAIPEGDHTDSAPAEKTSTHSFNFNTELLNYGEYAFSYTPTFVLSGDLNTYEATAADQTLPIESRPTVELKSPIFEEGDILTNSTFTLVVEAGPREIDKIAKVEARVYSAADNEQIGEVHLEESSKLEKTITLPDGAYYITYRAFTISGKESKTGQSANFTIETLVEEEPTDPEDPPVEPTDPGNPTDPNYPENPETPETPTEPEEGEEEKPEDSEDDKEDNKDDDTKDVVLDAATFNTGLVGTADPFFTEIIGGRTIPLDNGDQTDSDKDTKSTTAGDAINKNETDEKGVAKFLGIAWYWWVAMLAGVTSIWSLVIASRNRTPDDSL